MLCSDNQALQDLSIVLSVIWGKNKIVHHWHDGIDSAFQLVSGNWITWNCTYMLYIRTYSTLLKKPNSNTEWKAGPINI